MRVQETGTLAEAECVNQTEIKVKTMWAGILGPQWGASSAVPLLLIQQAVETIREAEGEGMTPSCPSAG